MSGMAGNVTAFNTVWTYDIYQSYIRSRAPTTRTTCGWGGWRRSSASLSSIGAAYVATSFNNIMDLLQLVFAFVNAPLFATFLLGMFWKRTTANGAFWGLLGGTGAAAVHYGLTGVAGAHRLGWLHTYPSDMAQNFWGAIYAWTGCFVLTIAISFFTRRRDEKDLVGLVYSLTPKPSSAGLAWYGGRSCSVSSCWWRPSR